MYFFYFDESGNRDTDVGTPDRPKDPLYVLTAVGMYERKWHSFERAISLMKLEMADRLDRNGKGSFELVDCEVKSNWIRVPKARAKESRFLDSLTDSDRERLVATYFQQIDLCNATIISVVVDKRHLNADTTPELLHLRAYEFVLERIEHFMAEYHPKHQALIVMDDTSQQLNQSVAMRHAGFQRAGNKHLWFDHIVEYPFFSRSELSNGIQLADLVGYNIYRAFKDRNVSYPYFQEITPYIYRQRVARQLNGLKVWPPQSELVPLLSDILF